MKSVADVDVVVVGSGFSGIGMGVALREAGRSFVILEKAAQIGGTWRENRYPGVTCDVPSHLYSFSFEPNPYWSHTYSSGDVIQDYLLWVVEKHDLRRDMRFDAWVQEATYDDETGVWSVMYGSAGGQRTTITARAVVLGVGALHVPHIPHIDGLHAFGGELIHTASWPEGASMFDRRVGVIGTGASAVQVIPPVAQDAAHLTVFQRSAPWIMPQNNTEYGDDTIDHFERFPAVQRAHRQRHRTQNDLRAVAFDTRPKLMEFASKQSLRHLRNQVSDLRLRAALTPDYTMGCKRVILSDRYYPALMQDNVDVVTAPIVEVDRTGIVTADGEHVDLDTIVMATGFDPSGSYRHLMVQGRNGRNFPEDWRAGVETYLGVTMADYPNLFMLLGPNTALGHTSVVLMIEAQIKLVLTLLEERDRRGMKSVEVREQLVTSFTREMHERTAKSVWHQGGCTSWYLDADGENRSLWPGGVGEYERRTTQPDFIDYLFR